MSSLAQTHLSVPVTLDGHNFDDEDPVVAILKECVDFVNLPDTSGYVTTLQAHSENAKVICDMCWEMLNIGDWKNVPLHWRQMNSFGSLLKALCELGLEKSMKDILHFCDMGLIMGGSSLLEKVDCQEPHSVTLKFRLSRIECPSLEQFMNTYLLTEKPVIITKGDGPLACIVDTTMEIPELHNDICVPTYCSLSEKEDVEPDINLWFVPEGTVSPLHHDPKNNLLAQVFGEKYIRLYEKSQTSFLVGKRQRRRRHECVAENRKEEVKGAWSVAAKVREKERERWGSLLGCWVLDPSLVTAEPGQPATCYLPWPCVADVLRLQDILCPRTREAVGLRARVPAEVSGWDVAMVVVPTLRVAAWSTVRTT
ncbi:hypothetical protein MRX96_034804 [Rhipicephalus microplus]